jgi:hypothetical protein
MSAVRVHCSRVAGAWLRPREASLAEQCNDQGTPHQADSFKHASQRLWASAEPARRHPAEAVVGRPWL